MIYSVYWAVWDIHRSFSYSLNRQDFYVIPSGPCLQRHLAELFMGTKAVQLAFNFVIFLQKYMYSRQFYPKENFLLKFISVIPVYSKYAETKHVVSKTVI